MYNIWKRLFIATIMILVICCAFTGLLVSQLNTSKKQLANTIAQLADTVSELNSKEKQLSDTESQLDANTVLLSTTTAQLESTATKLSIANNQLELARNENIQTLNQYSSLKNQISTRLASTSQDRQSFITPNASSVSAKVQEIAGDYSGDVNEVWRDYKRLYRWVVNNVTYSYDSYMPVLPETISGSLIWREECWRLPEETIEDKTGDCEDMATLLASMLLSYNEGKYAIWVLGIHSDDPEIPGHLAVAFPVVSGKLTILDPAGNYYTGYPYESLRSESASVAINNWLSHWSKAMPNAEIDKVFSHDFYNQFSSTAEFLTWVKER